ncbi:MAG: CPBP family intramembrane metalloprotease [Simkaniaceae bacterium]|nr:CPBP family intramembrane metalloprotease [Simkaniaceae bacterium]
MAVPSIYQPLIDRRDVLRATQLAAQVVDVSLKIANIAIGTLACYSVVQLSVSPEIRFIAVPIAFTYLIVTAFREWLGREEEDTTTPPMLSSGRQIFDHCKSQWKMILISGVVLSVLGTNSPLGPSSTIDSKFALKLAERPGLSFLLLSCVRVINNPYTIIGAPILEELMFRNYFQPFLEDLLFFYDRNIYPIARETRETIANMGQAICFGWAHSEKNKDIFWNICRITTTAYNGVQAGSLRNQYQSIIPSMTQHFLFNISCSGYSAARDVMYAVAFSAINSQKASSVIYTEIN